MKINAYVLAADPTWLATSVLAYYEQVDRLVVSYDQSGTGWTGSPIEVEACLVTLRAIDVEHKIDWAAGDFAVGRTTEISLAEAETRQRQAALDRASINADWVLQIDSDEVLPSWEPLTRQLVEADRRSLSSVEWPMRVLYRRLRDGRFLEVINDQQTTHFEYPGPIAVRAGSRLSECRRVGGRYLRPVVPGDNSLQSSRPLEDGEDRSELDHDWAIWHNSWARPPAAMRSKLGSWGHNQGLRSWLYYYSKWLPAPIMWRTMRRFHPLYPPLWPRLAVAPSLPFAIASADSDE